MNILWLIPGNKKDRSAWVMNMDGKILSQDCNVDLNVTTKAFRIDMETTYPKAVNYSILTTFICLFQVVVRQSVVPSWLDMIALDQTTLPLALARTQRLGFCSGSYIFRSLKRLPRGCR